jgi:hypothetical protein
MYEVLPCSLRLVQRIVRLIDKNEIFCSTGRKSFRFTNVTNNIIAIQRILCTKKIATMLMRLGRSLSRFDSLIVTVYVSI